MACAARLAALLLIGLLASACETTDDPTRGGLWGGIHGLSSGAYEQRLQERRERLSRLEQARYELETQSRTLSDEHRSRQRSVEAERARLQALRGNLSRLEDATRELEARQQTGNERTRELRQRMSTLDRQLAALDRTAPNERLVELERERQALDQEYRALLDLYLELEQ